MSERFVGRILAVAAALAALLLCLGTATAAAVPDPLVSEARAKDAYVFAEFVSKTCPACEEMRPIVESVLGRYKGVLHQVHDADREAELAKSYEVRCVPVYVVVDPKGRVRYNDVGTRTAEELHDILREAGLRRR